MRGSAMPSKCVCRRISSNLGSFRRYWPSNKRQRKASENRLCWKDRERYRQITHWTSSRPHRGTKCILFMRGRQSSVRCRGTGAVSGRGGRISWTAAHTRCFGILMRWMQKRLTKRRTEAEKELRAGFGAGIVSTNDETAGRVVLKRY